MIEFFKMCRITCDQCRKTNFEVFTFERTVDPPTGWMNVTSYGWGATGYSRTMLCCPECVRSASREDKVDKCWGIELDPKRDGSGGY